MKKLAVFLLAFTLLFSLVACGGAVSENEGDSSGNTNTASSEAGIANSSQSDNTDDAQNNSNDDNNNELTFTEIVAVNNDECAIKITGIDPDNLWGYTLKVELENKSTEKNYMYSIENASINGVRCDPLFASEVAAGKKSNDEINFSDSDLKENGVGAYTDIELTFRVHDSDDWMADAVATETVHIYPYGEDKATVFVREAQANDNVIIDNDYVTVIVTGYEDDPIWGYTVNLFLLNKTDKEVMFCVDEASVNGYMADPIYATKVVGGKCAFSAISWSDTTFEDNNITEVEEIEFKFRAYDNDNWFGDDFANEAITLNP